MAIILGEDWTPPKSTGPGHASLDRMVEAHRGKFEDTLVCGIPLTELTPDQLRASLVRAHEALLKQAAHRTDFNMFNDGGRR